MNISRGDLKEHILIHRKVRLRRGVSCSPGKEATSKPLKQPQIYLLAVDWKTRFGEIELWENDIFSHINGIFFEEENIKLQSSKAEVIAL